MVRENPLEVWKKPTHWNWVQNPKTVKKKKSFSQKRNWRKEVKWVAWLTGDERWAIEHFPHSAVFSSFVLDAGRVSCILWRASCGPHTWTTFYWMQMILGYKITRSDLSCTPEELWSQRKISKTASLGKIEMLGVCAASTCEELHDPWAGRNIILPRLVTCPVSGSISS